mmetsp:Transcript_2270/g.7194  ORF Transcript_2270/g.7194 Transcript_2270/m.7194 type:complete len:227 (+) Transcript_2270:1324-2004(+)
MRLGWACAGTLLAARTLLAADALFLGDRGQRHRHDGAHAAHAAHASGRCCRSSRRGSGRRRGSRASRRALRAVTLLPTNRRQDPRLGWNSAGATHLPIAAGAVVRAQEGLRGAGGLVHCAHEHVEEDGEREEVRGAGTLGIKVPPEGRVQRVGLLLAGLPLLLQQPLPPRTRAAKAYEELLKLLPRKHGLTIGGSVEGSLDLTLQHLPVVAAGAAQDLALLSPHLL